MSLYHMLHGVNPLASLMLATIDIDFRNVPRFRDTFVDVETNEIILLTRCGGGNREGYEKEFEPLMAHEAFLRDEDDDFDSTYRRTYFRQPEILIEAIKHLNGIGDDTTEEDVRAAYERFLGTLEPVLVAFQTKYNVGVGLMRVKEGE